MSYEATRTGLANLLATGWAASAYAALPIEWENLKSIDHNQRAGPFLTAELKWRDAAEASIEENPLTRYAGELLLRIHLKEGDASRQALQIADALTAILKYKVVGAVRLTAPRLLGAADVKGWRVWPIPTSFTFTS